MRVLHGQLSKSGPAVAQLRRVSLPPELLRLLQAVGLSAASADLGQSLDQRCLDRLARRFGGQAG
jgi:hypothetical protein